MKNAYRVACLAIFVAGLVVYSHTANKRDSQAAVQEIQPYADAEPARSHVVTYVHSEVAPDGSVRVVGTRIRYVKANGEFKSIMRGSDDKEPIIYSGLSDDTYLKPGNSPERTLLTPSPQNALDVLGNAFRSAAFLRNHKTFVRMDEVAGLEVFVLRAERGGDWMETSYSPKTGTTPLRSIDAFSDGSKVIIEATKVQFVDVPDDLNGDMEALPVKVK